MRLEAEENLWRLFYPQKKVSDSKLSLKRMEASRIGGPREPPRGEHGPRGGQLTARLPRPGAECQHQGGCAEPGRTIPKAMQCDPGPASPIKHTGHSRPFPDSRAQLEPSRRYTKRPFRTCPTVLESWLSPCALSSLMRQAGSSFCV